MEIKIARTTHSISNKPQNIDIVRWKSMNISTQPVESDDRKSEVNQLESGKQKEWNFNVNFDNVFNVIRLHPTVQANIAKRRSPLRLQFGISRSTVNVIKYM